MLKLIDEIIEHRLLIQNLITNHSRGDKHDNDFYKNISSLHISCNSY